MYVHFTQKLSFLKGGLVHQTYRPMEIIIWIEGNFVRYTHERIYDVFQIMGSQNNFIKRRWRCELHGRVTEMSFTTFLKSYIESIT